MVLVGNNWSGGLEYPDVTVVDGDMYNISVRAFNLAGQSTLIQQQVTVDLLPPSAFSATISYDSGSGTFVPVGTNETISDVLQPELRVDWTASSDPSGISDYLAKWYEILQDGTLVPLQQQNVGSALTNTYSGASEPQRLFAEIEVRDGAGNLTTIEAGPIYLDYSQTPAYIDMSEFGRNDDPYRNWIADSCNRLGIDYRLAEAAAGLTDLQSFYGTWNADGLRLAWTGANWDSDGDLFIYLDEIDNYNGYRSRR